MKAYVNALYGPPSVLNLQETALPVPGPEEVLVKVKASSVNPADTHMMRGTPIVARASFGWSAPNYKILGHDFAGIVQEVGEKVKKFKAGDEVYGEVERGAFAQYLISHQDTAALKPKKASFTEAAAIPLAGVTALQGLVDQGGLQEGMHVLINGASGGVGIFAVQIAKALGARVTAVCSTGKVEQVYSLGADLVLDYTKQDFTELPSSYDIILDLAGSAQAFSLRSCLKPKGICVLIGMSSFGHLLRTALLGSLGTLFSKKRFKMFVAQSNTQDLEKLAALFDQGKIQSLVAQEYPFSQLKEALACQETGHSPGKVVIDMD